MMMVSGFLFIFATLKLNHAVRDAADKSRLFLCPDIWKINNDIAMSWCREAVTPRRS